MEGSNSSNVCHRGAVKLACFSKFCQKRDLGNDSFCIFANPLEFASVKFACSTVFITVVGFLSRLDGVVNAVFNGTLSARE